MLKIKISTSVWSAQHPNAGQNIQHLEHLIKLRVQENQRKKVEL